MLTLQVIEDIEKKRFIIDIEEFQNVFGEGETLDEAFKHLAVKLLKYLEDNALIFKDKIFPKDETEMIIHLKKCYQEQGSYFPLL